MAGNPEVFRGRLGLQQRVLPSYRLPFFNALAQGCAGGLGVFAGAPLPVEGISSASHLEFASLYRARNRHFRDPASAWYFLWQDGILHWLETWQPDALVVEANPRYLATRLAIRWMRRRHRPVIGWGLGAPRITSALQGFIQWERQNFLNSLDAIIAYSQRGAAQYRSIGFPSRRIYVATNAVAPPPGKPPIERPLSFQEKPVVLFVGRLQQRKRVDLLLHACAGMPETLQPRLLVVGDGPARQELEVTAQQVYPQAEFAGSQYGESLDAYFDRADLFVLPGTGGLAVQQAMAHALPVIVAQGDGTQDDLVLPEVGWQVQPDDLFSLKSALQDALSSPVRLRQMGREAYRVVADKVNTAVMVKIFIQALNEIAPLR